MTSKITKANYMWVITKDNISCSNYTDVGTEGPRYHKSPLDNKTKFSLYDDDKTCYYEGFIFGEFDGFEPLDDFGMPNSGCTLVKLNGVWL